MNTQDNYSDAQRDLILMVGHAVRTPPCRSLPNEEIIQAIAIASADTTKLNTQNASQIFKSLDYFSRYLSPATLDGLRFAYAKNNNIKLISTLQVFYIFGLLFITVTLQCYALFGSIAITNIDKNSDTIAGIQREIQAMQAALPALRDAKEQMIATHDSLLTYISSNYNVSNSQLTTYLHKQDSLKGAEYNQCNAYQAIYRFNWPWGIAVAFGQLRNPRSYWGEELCLSEDIPTKNQNVSLIGASKIFFAKQQDCVTRNHAGCQIAYGGEFEARYIVRILDVIVLPVLYSMLGAWVWVIRDRYARMKQRNLIESDLTFPIARLSLAAALGSIVGFLNTATAIGTTAASVPLAGLGFIVGYNVGIVFKWLDGLGTAGKLQQPSATADAAVPTKPETKSMQPARSWLRWKRN